MIKKDKINHAYKKAENIGIFDKKEEPHTAHAIRKFLFIPNMFL